MLLYVFYCLISLKLQETAMDQASELFKANEDHDLLKCLKTAGINGDVKKVDELSVKFEEHREQLEEVKCEHYNFCEL